jgi:hypothetical protein
MLKMSNTVRYVKQNKTLICTCAGTRSILPDVEMSSDSGSSDEASDLNSSREEIDKEMTEEEAHEFRTLRRERLLEAERILDKPDEKDGGHNLRKQAMVEQRMETEEQGENLVTEPASGQTDRAAEGAPGDAAAADRDCSACC